MEQAASSERRPSQEAILELPDSMGDTAAGRLLFKFLQGTEEPLEVQLLPFGRVQLPSPFREGFLEYVQ
jgi:hypothetical protein